jgi:uncharacterized protein YxjI
MKPKLIIEQKITAFANKYLVYSAQADGSKDELTAYAQQKRLAIREKIIFYSDESKSQALFSFRAEKVMDVHGRYLVEDADGKLIGTFKKEFAKSLINSTWNILGSSDQPLLTISESSQALAIFRRFGGVIPIVGAFVEIITALLRYHFVFTIADTGQVVGTYKKTTLFRDHYLLSIEDEAYSQVDWRTFVSMAVALDALQSR